MPPRMERITNRLLLPIEGFLRTDVRYLLRGTFWLTIGKSVGILIAFGLSILYARYLPKELYGEYRYVLSLLGTFAVFSLSDIGMAITRSIARGQDGAWIRGTRVMLLSSFGMTVAALIASLYFYTQRDISLAMGFLAVAFLAPFAEGLGGWRAYFDGKRDFRTKTTWNVLAQLFAGTLVAGAVIYISRSVAQPLGAIAILAGAYVAGRAFPNIFFSLLIWRKHIQTKATSDPNAVRYGIHLSIVKIPATIATYIDSILLYTYLGPVPLAIYSFALAPVDQVKALLTNIADVGFPKFSEKTQTSGERALLRATLPRKLLKASLITGAGALFYIAAAPLLFRIVFPAYTASVIYSQVIALSIILFPLGIFSTAIKAEGDLKNIYLYSIGAPVVQILLFVLLIPSFGLWGAAAGKALGRLSNHAILTFLYLRARG